MLLTLGLTGMDQATEATLKTSFADANEHLGYWSLQSEADAEYVIVDMDSMYGPMSWLRLHAAGKRVLGLTTAPRTQADYRLARPVSSETLHDLLAHIANERGAGISHSPLDMATEAMPSAPQSTQPQSTSTAVARPPVPQALQSPAAAAVATPVPQPAALPPAPAVAPYPTSVPVAATTFPPAPTTATTAPAVAEEPLVETQATAPGRGASFMEWLRPGALDGRARYRSGKGPVLLIDFAGRQYFGPTTLKPLAEYFVENIGLRDFEQLDEPTWQAAIATTNSGPQPLTRLQWFGALLAGEGRLTPGFSTDGKFLLNKWPQTEREYPRHFRIATAMMKGPMTIADIATASGVPAPDVIDFINANLITGFAEPVGTESDAVKGSLLGKLRGR